MTLDELRRLTAPGLHLHLFEVAGEFGGESLVGESADGALFSLTYDLPELLDMWEAAQALDPFTPETRMRLTAALARLDAAAR